MFHHLKVFFCGGGGGSLFSLFQFILLLYVSQCNFDAILSDDVQGRSEVRV